MGLVGREARRLQRSDRFAELGDQLGGLGRELGQPAPRAAAPDTWRRRVAASSARSSGRLRLDVELRHVLLGEHLVARIQLANREHALVGEQRLCLVRDQVWERVRSGAEIQQPALLGVRVPLLGVVVTTEDDLLVSCVAADRAQDSARQRAPRRRRAENPNQTSPPSRANVITLTRSRRRGPCTAFTATTHWRVARAATRDTRDAPESLAAMRPACHNLVEEKKRTPSTPARPLTADDSLARLAGCQAKQSPARPPAVTRESGSSA